MTKYFLPKFVERFNKNGHRSAIINLSSICNWEIIPNLSLYCATKAFNSAFSTGTRKEYSKYIDVLTVYPRNVKS